MAKEEIILHENQQTMFEDELKEHIDPIVKGITFNNIHLIAKELYEKDKDLCVALIDELEAEIKFGIKKGK